MNKLIALFLVIVFLQQSCKNGVEKIIPENKQKEEIVDKVNAISSVNEDAVENQNSVKISLGEDTKEINSYAIDIYEKNGVIYIDLDFVDIKYENIDERVIVNKNPKIRTYIIDIHTLIVTKECKELKASDMLKQKDNLLLSDKTIIVIGEAKNGRMLSINFGCYG